MEMVNYHGIALGGGFVNLADNNKLKGINSGKNKRDFGQVLTVKKTKMGGQTTETDWLSNIPINMEEKSLGEILKEQSNKIHRQNEEIKILKGKINTVINILREFLEEELKETEGEF